MDNKTMKVKKCTKEEIGKCNHVMSERKWGDEYVCEVLRPIDCPKLLCEGEPCLAGTIIDTNSEEVEFPCSTCKKPTKEELVDNKARFLKEMGLEE